MADIKYGGSGPSHQWAARAFPRSVIHVTSLSVTPIEILNADGDKCSHGTGFTYVVGNERYFVTAWHVVSGRNFFTRKLNPDGLIPSRFRIFYLNHTQNGAHINVETRYIDFSLTEESITRLTQPPEVFGIPVDVAVGRFPWKLVAEGDLSRSPLKDLQWGIPERTRTPIQTPIGSDVFVLGYPLATYEGACTPLWKRGVLASEPSFSITPQGAFLIDINCTSGMSGGPIIRRVTTMTLENRDKGLIEEHYDECVLGIYTGRGLSATEKNLSLGYGWPIDTVHEIIARNLLFTGWKE